MRFENATVFCDDGVFRQKSFTVSDGIFCAAKAKDSVIDLNGKTVIPGLIDTHIHGAQGYDFTYGSIQDLKNLSLYLAKNGTTSFVPTLLTAPFSVLKNACSNALAANNLPQSERCASIIGIHMEGPFISDEKKGAHNAQYLLNPDVDFYKELNKISCGLIKIVSLAPELKGAISFFNTVKKSCVVSAAHTACNYAQAKNAFEAGISRLTHLFNAMPPLLHRDPGIIGAAAESKSVYAELICDGKHVHESAVRAAFKLFGEDRIILISDSVCVCEPPGNGNAGLHAVIKDGVAVLSDGVTIAGSVTPLFECVKKAALFGIPVETAILAATKNPALSIGVYDKTGSITQGKHADFIVCDTLFNIESVYIGGEKVS